MPMFKAYTVQWYLMIQSPLIILGCSNYKCSNWEANLSIHIYAKHLSVPGPKISSIRCIVSNLVEWATVAQFQ